LGKDADRWKPLPTALGGVKRTEMPLQSNFCTQPIPEVGFPPKMPWWGCIGLKTGFRAAFGGQIPGKR